MDPSRSSGYPAPHPSDPAMMPSGAPPSETASFGGDAVRLQCQALQQRGQNGANWFFWIAALSLVNSVILLSGSTVHFVIGLGVTFMADLIAKAVGDNNPNAATLVKGAAFCFDLAVALVVVLFGWLARSRYQVMFAIGMFLYLLDGLVYVLVQDWMSVGFHAFALFCMWNGFTAYRQLNALERATMFPPIAPVPLR
jgi:hypothetical protein